MLLMRLAGVFALIPTTILLTVSFFVLLAIGRLQEKTLKAFGYVVAALLWLSAFLVISAGIYTFSTGRCLMTQMMMKQKMHCMRMMHERDKPLPMMPAGDTDQMRR
jgi:hypothetical protein